MNINVSIAVIVISLTSITPAQQQPAAAPVSQPASAPAPPRKVAVPKGFKRVDINGRAVLLEPADEGWVTAAMSKIQATTKPATQPAAILARLLEKREPIIRMIMADVAMPDPVAIANYYDTKIMEPVRLLDTLHPPVLFLVTTKDRLAELLKNGWEDPHYYYNRAADSVTFNPSGVLSADRPDDETVFPGAYNATDTPEKRQETLNMAVASTEAAIAAAVDTRARLTSGAAFAELIQNLVTKPLNLKEDQNWFGLGIGSVLSAKYAADIIAVPQKDLMASMTFEHPNNPLKTSAIDLLHPRDTSLIRTEFMPFYLDTVRRKSTKAIMHLVEKAGDVNITKSIVAIREKKPADGAAMVKVIQEATGVDLTNELAK